MKKEKLTEMMEPPKVPLDDQKAGESSRPQTAWEKFCEDCGIVLTVGILVLCGLVCLFRWWPR